jgi:hypothetical protein
VLSVFLDTSARAMPLLSLSCVCQGSTALQALRVRMRILVLLAGSAHPLVFAPLSSARCAPLAFTAAVLVLLLPAVVARQATIVSLGRHHPLRWMVLRATFAPRATFVLRDPALRRAALPVLFLILRG